jgi:hypothetical protein
MSAALQDLGRFHFVNIHISLVSDITEIISRLHLQNRNQALAYASQLGLKPDD